MQPTQPLPPAPAPPPMPLPPTPNKAPNPYDFILNHNQPKPGMFKNNSQKQRIIIVAAGAGLLLILAIIVMAVLSSGGKTDVTSLESLAEQQQEIIRVAKVGVQKSTGDSAQDLAITTELSVLSTQTDTLSLLAKSGHKLSQGSLALKKDASADQQLTNATNNNTFDDTFSQIIKKDLTAYRTSLESVYKSSTSPLEKQILQTSFNGVTLLIGDQVASQTQ